MSSDTTSIEYDKPYTEDSPSNFDGKEAVAFSEIASTPRAVAEILPNIPILEQVDTIEHLTTLNTVTTTTVCSVDNTTTEYSAKDIVESENNLEAEADTGGHEEDSEDKDNEEKQTLFQPSQLQLQGQENSLPMISFAASSEFSVPQPTPQDVEYPISTPSPSPFPETLTLRLITNVEDSILRPPALSDRRRHSSANLSPTANSGDNFLAPIRFPEQKRYSLIDAGPLEPPPGMGTGRRTMSAVGLTSGTPPLRRPRRSRQLTGGLDGDVTESGSSSSRPSTARYSTFAEMGIQGAVMAKGEKTIDVYKRRKYKEGNKEAKKGEMREGEVMGGDNCRKMSEGKVKEREEKSKGNKGRYGKTLLKSKSRDCVIM
ncbi:hypothetical protein EW145_g6181 [Phellinidium pouzarii]|uniref:Uncharacterized protein n=1 Tax=Phellinidium pouzarii TaxID=167371 RepID=A0A4S4KXE6_9AGAM|nr:hypothetical protein EW145_g6181 [Phellinidium pouzarii]